MTGIVGNTVIANPGFMVKPFVMPSDEKMYLAESEHIRRWLADNAPNFTGEVRPVLQVLHGVVQKIEMESRRVIFKK